MTVPGQEPNPQAGQEPGGQTPPAAQATPPPAGQEPAQSAAPETFSREYVEQLRREAADFRKRATTAEGKVTEHEREKLSDAERLTAEATEWKAKATDLESKYQTAIIRAAVDREAMKQGAVDPDAVFALMDRSELQVSDDGTVANTEKAVKALLASKPYLVKTEDAGAPAAARTQAIPGTPKPTREVPKTRDDVIEQTRKELLASGQYGRL